MSSYFVNSLMQRYCNHGTPPMYAAAAAAAAALGRSVDGSLGCCGVAAQVNDAAASFSTSSLTGRHQQQQVASAQHYAARLPSQSTCLYSLPADVQSMSECGHPTPSVGEDVFTDTLIQSTSSSKLLPPLPYSMRPTRQPSHVDTSPASVYGNYCQQQQQLYDAKSLIAGLNGYRSTYKVERPSPPTSPNTESRQDNATETWNCGAAQHINVSDEQVSGRLQTQQGQDEDHTSDTDDVVAPPDDHHSTSSDVDSDDLEPQPAGSQLSQIPTTMKTESDQQQQQLLQQVPRNKNNCDVKQSPGAVVYPIYPWMTRMHNTHGKSRTLCNVQTFDRLKSR